ncbi:MAG: hypothetical protein J5727_06875 [Kiritimatiellae bacterium]|nr:hypothetical protein [Kiritimatiellia bacterium]
MTNTGFRGAMVTACVATAFSAMADEFTFQAVVPNSDGTSYCWTNTANWVGGVVPGYSDIWVFDPGAGNTLDVTVPTRTGSLYYRFAGIKVKSGTVNFKSGTYIYANGSPAVLDVAEGAKVQCNVTFDFQNTSGVRKTGAGTFEAASNFGKDKTVSSIDIQEGRLQFGLAGGVKATSIRIRGGAACAAYNYNINLGNVQIDKGGTLRLKGGSGKVTVANLTGEGDVVSDDGGSYTDFQVKPSSDSVFSGTMSVPVRPIVMTSATARFILGAGNVFAGDMIVTGSKWLGFAPGVGTFTLGRYRADSGFPLNLADTNGVPVKAVVRLQATELETFATTGPGDVQTEYNALSLLGGKVQSTGTLSTLVSLTLGDGTAANDFDFSTLTGLNVASSDGSIAINNSGATTVGAKVSGRGPLTVRSPTTFNDFCHSSTFNVGADVTVAGGDSSPASIAFTVDGKTLTLAGGTMTRNASPTYGAGVAAATLCLDGGTFRTAFASATTLSPFGTAVDALSLTVGSGGGNLVSVPINPNEGYACYVSIPKSFASAVAEGVDGGLRLTGYPDFVFGAPQAFTGTFEAEGGVVTVAAGADISGSGGFFGNGDLVLRNEALRIAKRNSAGTVHLAGEGKALRTEGGSMLTLRDDASGAAMSVEIPGLAVGADAALVLYDNVASVGAEGGSTVKVAGGTVETSAASGRVLANVFGSADGGKTFYFLGYDAEKGFVSLPGVTRQSSFDGVTANDVLEFAQNSGAWYMTADNREFAIEALSVKGQMTLRLGANTTVTIGDGVHPGVLALEKKAQLSGESGAGINFGAAQGLLLVGANESAATSHCTLSARILTANGLAIMGTSDNTVFHALSLTAANAYSGVTRIGAACVRAGNVDCFSSGDVYVLPGERHGGQVRFTSAKTWTNNFHVAGNGIGNSQYGGRQGNGALSFATNAVVSGCVELMAPARFNTTDAAVTGKVTGIVSGDKLWLYDTPGVIELDGANTYTGGTDVVKSTLALGCGDSAGTGVVLLDQGVLRFVNETPVVFTNDVSGSGTIEILGAPVTFTGKAFAALNGWSVAKGTVMDFPAVTSGDILYAAILSNDTLDLGGKDATVSEVWGSGTISGGTLTVTGEMHPGGRGAIGMLTFDRPPVFVAGATLVCEDLNGDCDKIVVGGGDLALGDLALAFTLIGESLGKGPATIVDVTNGAVSGAFSSVEKTPKRAERAEVKYGVSLVKMAFSSGLAIFVR